jgi:mannan endo-1,4-beta-mannosidase
MKAHVILLIISLPFLSNCHSGDMAQSQSLVDENATRETKELFSFLKSIPLKGFLVGQQDATPYGVGWEYERDSTRCDMRDVCGDYPAVYGWDLGLIEYDGVFNIDTVNFKLIRKLITEAYARGGIITISWHLRNPVTDENAWSQTETVSHILPGGDYHARFVKWLTKVARFMSSLKDEKGNPVPVIFRPWHEWNGSWFWWGDSHCTNAQFIDLWKMTVTTLRDSLGVHNLLYAYSSDAFKDESEYLRKYPGDGFVDLLGLDIYVHENNLIRYREDLSRDLSLLKRMAAEHGKVYAVTETGYEGIPDTTWYTKTLYPTIRNSGISYVLFWRNANTKHHYVPYPGHKSAGDFKRFYERKETLFNRDL